MRYDAFISYRHSELDMEIAKKLHKGLETFKIPASVRKKFGKKRIERVFRDQEELPIGSDLDDNITAALAESEYLIVICSPRTPKSVWVCKEIETFIKLHDRSHALAILIEGEPNESFPPQLLVDENGKPVEPLAADIRGETKKERDKKFKTELMRLVAPLVGCEYDDLKQRHRERIIRRNVCFAAVILLITAALGIAFGFYNAVIARNMEELANRNADLAMEKSSLAAQIFDQFQETQKNQSRFYAEKSLSLLNEGKREAAVLTAMEGLPVNDDDERPYVPENEYALSSALHVYDDGSYLDHDRLLHHEQIVDSIRSCADGKYLVSYDRNENVYVWDSENWNLKTMIPCRVNKDSYIESVVDAYADEDRVYVVTTNTFTAYDFSGKQLYQNDDSYDYVSSELCSDENIMLLIKSDEACCVDTGTGKVLQTITNTAEESFTARGSYMGDGVYAISHLAADDTPGCITVVDLDTGESTNVTLKYGHILKTAGSSKGRIAVVSCNSDFFYGAGVTELGLELFDSKGNVIWSRDLNIQIINAVTFSTYLKIQDYNDKVFFSVERGAYIYDAADGTETGRIALSGDLEQVLLSTNSDYGCIGYSNGVMDWIDTVKASVIDSARIDSRIALTDMCFFGSQRLVSARTSPDVYVLSYHKGKDIEELAELEEHMLPEAVAPDGGYYMMSTYSDGKIHYFFDQDGEQLYKFDASDKYPIDIFCTDDKTLIATSEGIWKVDPYKAKAELTDYGSMGSSDLYINGCFSENGKYCVLWTGVKLGVFDLEEETLLFNKEFEDSIGCAVVTTDGSELYVSQNGKNLTKINTDNGSEREYADVNLRETADINDGNFLAVSGSGKIAAMFCSDGKVRVIDTEDERLLASISVQARYSAFIQFDEKGKHLLMQGDDNTIYIYNIENNEYSCIIDTAFELRYVMTGDDRVVCCDGSGIHLLEAGSFVRIAYIPDGIAYIPSEKSFIQRDGNEVYKSKYMNYQELIEEAKRQFPGSKLGPKERKEYNIE